MSISLIVNILFVFGLLELFPDQDLPFHVTQAGIIRHLPPKDQNVESYENNKRDVRKEKTHLNRIKAERIGPDDTPPGKHHNVAKYNSIEFREEKKINTIENPTSFSNKSALIESSKVKNLQSNDKKVLNQNNKIASTSRVNVRNADPRNEIGIGDSSFKSEPILPLSNDYYETEPLYGDITQMNGSSQPEVLQHEISEALAASRNNYKPISRMPNINEQGDGLSNKGETIEPNSERSFHFNKNSPPSRENWKEHQVYDITGETMEQMPEVSFRYNVKNSTSSTENLNQDLEVEYNDAYLKSKVERSTVAYNHSMKFLLEPVRKEETDLTTKEDEMKSGHISVEVYTDSSKPELKFNFYKDPDVNLTLRVERHSLTGEEDSDGKSKRDNSDSAKSVPIGDKTISIKAVNKKVEQSEQTIYKISDNNDSMALNASDDSLHDDGDIFKMAAPLSKLDKNSGGRVAWDLKRGTGDAKFVEIRNPIMDEQGISNVFYVGENKNRDHREVCETFFCKIFNWKPLAISLIVIFIIMMIVLLLTAFYSMGKRSRNKNEYSEINSRHISQGESIPRNGKPPTFNDHFAKRGSMLSSLENPRRFFGISNKSHDAKPNTNPKSKNDASRHQDLFLATLDEELRGEETNKSGKSWKKFKESTPNINVKQTQIRKHHKPTVEYFEAMSPKETSGRGQLEPQMTNPQRSVYKKDESRKLLISKRPGDGYNAACQSSEEQTSNEFLVLPSRKDTDLEKEKISEKAREKENKRISIFRWLQQAVTGIPPDSSPENSCGKEAIAYTNKNSRQRRRQYSGDSESDSSPERKRRLRTKKKTRQRQKVEGTETSALPNVKSILSEIDMSSDETASPPTYQGLRNKVVTTGESQEIDEMLTSNNWDRSLLTGHGFETIDSKSMTVLMTQDPETKNKIDLRKVVRHGKSRTMGTVYKSRSPRAPQVSKNVTTNEWDVRSSKALPRARHEVKRNKKTKQ